MQLKAFAVNQTFMVEELFTAEEVFSSHLTGKTSLHF